MNRIASSLLAALLLVGTEAFAYPEGAPWGSADPQAAENCGACHYDYEPVRDSAALDIEGLPETADAGRVYDLVIRFTPEGAAVSGFQLLATAEGMSAGQFESARADIESIGPASRSTSPLRASDNFAWQIRWRAPQADVPAVTFLLAASAANDDQSPFGDTIHFREFRATLREPE